VSGNEYKALLGHLAGAWRNHVFHAFGIVATQRVAEAKLISRKGPTATGVLEKLKRIHGISTARAPKRTRILDKVLSGSPLHDKGESEDVTSKDNNSLSRGCSHPVADTVATVVPVMTMLACLDLEFSAATENAKEEADNDIQVIVDSSAPARTERDGAPCAQEELAKASTAAAAPTEFEARGTGPKVTVALRTTVVTSFVMLTRRHWLSNLG